MKKLLLLVVVAAVVIAGGFAASNHYKNYQNKRAHDAVVAQQQAAAAEDARIQPFRDRVAELKGQFNAQVVECEKGVVAYGKLTQVVKNQTPQPTCAKPVQ